METSVCSPSGQVIAKTGTVKAEPHMDAKLKTKKHRAQSKLSRCAVPGAVLTVDPIVPYSPI